MQFIDLKTQQARIKDKIDSCITSVLDHGKYIMGPEIMELESRLSEYVNVRHAIGCGSGTDALLMALLAENVRPGDAVLTTPFTFIATAEVIGLLGATAVFVDIDRKTFNIDPVKLTETIISLNSVQTDLHPLPQLALPSNTSLNIKGIIAVDLFGLTADYEKINAIANQYGLFVIEDAAQSFGATCNSRKACALSDIGCTSFFPAKPLGCYGDGGMCFTDNGELADIMKSVRVHGKGSHKYDNERIGINGRLDTIQAAILLAKFDIFTEEVFLRQCVAERYSELLAQITGITLPIVPDGYQSVWAQYSILAESNEHREQLQSRLQEKEIPTAIYYPKPLHLQTAYQYLRYEKGAFPISEDYSERIFSIPMHPYLKPDDQKKIAQILTTA